MTKSEGVLVVLDANGEDLGRIAGKAKDIVFENPSNENDERDISNIVNSFSMSIIVKFYPFCMGKLQKWNEAMTKLMTVAENAGLSEEQLQSVFDSVNTLYSPEGPRNSDFDTAIMTAESITIYLSGCSVHPVLRDVIEAAMEKHKNDLQS